MRPYFAPRITRSDAACAAKAPADPAEIARAWEALVMATRPHWPGGKPTRADLEGIEKRICTRFSITPEDLAAALF